jgi:serine/threonine protein kinase
MSPTILDYGDWLGNIEIIRPLSVLRSSVLYEAQCQTKKVFLKVAHPGARNSERLKREAQFLKDLRLDKTANKYFPVWLSPYSNSNDTDAYGKVVLKGQLLYYFQCEHFAGEPLRAILAKSPQLWVYHIGWTMIGLATAVTILQSKGLFSFGLSPDAVLLQFDNNSGPPAILLIDMGVITDAQGLALEEKTGSSDWDCSFVHPAYTAPELIDAVATEPNYSTDVYGLGIILYEMLVGQPVFPFKLRGDAEVKEAVRQDRRVSMTRIKDVAAVAQIAETAAARTPSLRYRDAHEMLKKLHEVFGRVPEKKRPIRPIMIVVAAGTLLSIVLLIAVVGQ